MVYLVANLEQIRQALAGVPGNIAHKTGLPETSYGVLPRTL